MTKDTYKFPLTMVFLLLSLSLLVAKPFLAFETIETVTTHKTKRIMQRAPSIFVPATKMEEMG